MTPTTRRQRLVEAVWSQIEGLPAASKVDRSLRTALTIIASTPASGNTHLVDGQGALDGVSPGDDLVIELQIAVTLDALRERPIGPHMAFISPVAALAEKFFEVERRVLSEFVEQATNVVSSAVPSFPKDVMERVLASRGRLGEGPLDLLLSQANADRLQGDNATSAGVQRALRGGAVLVAADRPVVDGLIVPHLPGFAVVTEIDPLAMEWDVHGEGGVIIMVSERLRVWRSEPSPDCVDLVIAKVPSQR